MKYNSAQALLIAQSQIDNASPISRLLFDKWVIEVSFRNGATVDFRALYYINNFSDRLRLQGLRVPYTETWLESAYILSSDPALVRPSREVLPARRRKGQS